MRTRAALPMAACSSRSPTSRSATAPHSARTRRPVSSRRISPPTSPVPPGSEIGSRRMSTCRRSAAGRGRPKLGDVAPDTIATVRVTVDRHRPPPLNRPRAPYQIYASDETGDVTLTYFNARRDFLEKLLPVGERRIVSGAAAFYDGMLQMVHPDRVVPESELSKLPLVEPVYPLTEGLGLNVVRKAAEAALAVG